MDLRLINEELLFITREKQQQKMLLIVNFSNHAIDYWPYFEHQQWRLILNSSEHELGEELPAFTILIFEQRNTDE